MIQVLILRRWASLFSVMARPLANLLGRAGDFLSPVPLADSRCVDSEEGSEWDDGMSINVRSVKLLTFQDLAQPPPKNHRASKRGKKAVKKIRGRRQKRKKAT